MFDLKRFCEDYDIEYYTEGKNVSPGWINIACPFHRDKSNHLGFNPVGDYFNCWECGWHSLENTIKILCDVNYYKMCSIIKEYSINRVHKTIKKVKVIPEFIQLPEGSKELVQVHQWYLIKRNFNPEYLERKYKLKGTGFAGDYAFRIIIPIFYSGVMVSYTSRDYTDKQEIRYKACKEEDEIISHKKILYNLDNCINDCCIVVEGIFDVFRLGDDSCAITGIQFSNEQVQLLSKRFKKIIILFDKEKQAQKQAAKLANALVTLGVRKVYVIEPDNKDPALFGDIEILKMKRKLYNM